MSWIVIGWKAGTFPLDTGDERRGAPAGAGPYTLAMSAARPHHPTVSVVMPVLNEAAYLPTALERLAAQTYPADAVEIVIVDGGSTDGTLDIAARAAAADSRIRVLGGPGVNCPAGMNLGIAATRGRYVAKVDGHGYPEREFLERAVGRLEADATLGCVGGRIVPLGDGEVQEANRIARFSVLGVGRGVYTLDAREQLVDTVQCGVYRREALDAVGGFDPALQFGEDEELNYRVRQAGFGILFDPRIEFRYWIRPTVHSLFRQYRNYGLARVRVVRKHPAFFSPKHAAPAAAVGALGIATAGLLVGPRAVRGISTLAIGGYLAAIGLGAAWLAIRHRFGRPDLIAASLAALHLGYGIGTLRGLWQWLRERP
jgi:succinoglycan biosynthesis protein ExoA